jgi:hypothetical protein
MARTVLTPSTLSPNAENALAAASAANADGHSIDPDGRPDLLVLHVIQGAGARAVTIVAGTDAPAERRYLGDLDVTVDASSESIIGPFEAARFMQADGLIYVDFDAVTNTTVRAYRLPDAT